MSKHMKKIIFSVVGLFMISSFVFAEDERQTTVDRAIGGMEEGGRIQAPGSLPLTDVHTTISSSQGTKKAEPSSVQPISVGGNHGNIYTHTGKTNNANNSGIAGSGTGLGESPTEPISNPTEGATGTGETGTGETSTESGGTQPVTEPSGETNNPIVETDININPDSGTVEADATVDTSGELEDRQIFDADLRAQDVTSVDAEVGSASEITGQEVVEEADVTTSGQTGQTSGSTKVETPTQETTNSPMTESGSTTGGTPESSEPSSNPIVDADVNVNPESGPPAGQAGTVETGVTIDTSGELEERQIIDADVAAGETTAVTEVGSAIDITQSEIVQSADITTQPVQTVIPIPSDLTAEVDTTGETGGSEADVGIEADASGLSEGEDVTCDPADALTSAACGLPQL